MRYPLVAILNSVLLDGKVIDEDPEKLLIDTTFAEL
jgi:hypothetical protein